MSLSNSLVVVASAAKDVSVVKDTAVAVAQNAAAAVSNVAGKGGFGTEATVGQLIEFQVTGLLVVFVVLGGLTLMCMLLAKILQTLAPDQYYCGKITNPVVQVQKPAPVTAQPTAPSSIHPGLTDDELIAILAVAASEAVGQTVSIVKFRHMDSMDWTWSVQGRVSLHSSHKPRL